MKSITIGIKYQSIPDEITHTEVWNVTKIRRKNTPYSISFGKYTFYWNLNSKIHGYLHFLDMNIGGTLESN